MFDDSPVPRKSSRMTRLKELSLPVEAMHRRFVVDAVDGYGRSRQHQEIDWTVAQEPWYAMSMSPDLAYRVRGFWGLVALRHFERPPSGRAASCRP